MQLLIFSGNFFLAANLFVLGRSTISAYLGIIWSISSVNVINRSANDARSIVCYCLFSTSAIINCFDRAGLALIPMLSILNACHLIGSERASVLCMQTWLPIPQLIECGVCDSICSLPSTDNEMSDGIMHWTVSNLLWSTYGLVLITCEYFRM